MIRRRVGRAAPVAVVVTLVLAASWPAAASDSPPLPRERPDFGTADQRTAQARELAPVVSEDIAAETKEALEHVFAKRFSEALAAQRELTDPLAISLVEFLYIREAGTQVPHQRIAAFLAAHRDWTAHRQLRRIHEVALLVQRADNAAVLQAFAAEPPITNPGVILYATALAARGE
jgi:hypothetical protein